MFRARNYEINIEISKERPWKYGLTLDDVRQAVFRGSLNLPAGIIRTDGEETRIRTIGRKYIGRDFRSTVVPLLFTPCLLTIVNDGRRLVHRVLYRQWPTPEEVEPARHRRRGQQVTQLEPLAEGELAV